MINASGFKVWPAEVEACSTRTRDPGSLRHRRADGYRGETVKAVIVPKPGAPGRLRPEDIIEWARGRMAAFKVRGVEFGRGAAQDRHGKDPVARAAGERKPKMRHAFFLLAVLATPALAQIEIENAWARATPPVQQSRPGT